MTSPETAFPFCDAALARRVEGAEAHGNAAFVEARARLFPETGARWIEVAGTYALYDGLGSPLTQTFGLGLFHPPIPADLDRIEAFARRHKLRFFLNVVDGELAAEVDNIRKWVDVADRIGASHMRVQ